MKCVYGVVLIFIFNASVVYGWGIRTINGYHISEDFKSLLSFGLEEECGFEENLPVYLIMDGEALKNRINGPHSSFDWYQILLLNDVYNIDGSVMVEQNIKLCGLHHWLPEVLTNLTTIANIDLVETFGNNTQFYSNLPDALYDDNRVKLIFKGDNNEYPAFYVKAFRIKLNNLGIYLHEQSQTYALYGAGCTSRTPYYACESFKETITYLNNVKLEDLTGIHPFLLRTEDVSSLYADRSEFNFKHHDIEGLVETAALYLYWTGNVQFMNSTVTNHGDRGRAILWEGIVLIDYEVFIKNTIIDTVSENASITGFYLEGFLDTEENNFILRDSQLPYFQNITFKQGVTIGFHFLDTNFYLRPTGSNGNRFEGNGTHCYGVPDGTISFDDGTVCTNAVPITGSVNTTQEFTDPAAIPTTQTE